MPRRVHVISCNAPGSVAFQPTVAVWVDIPAQLAQANPNATSQVASITPTELTLMKAGKIVERVFKLNIVPGTSVQELIATIETLYRQAQMSIMGGSTTLWDFFTPGMYWDPDTNMWVSS